MENPHPPGTITIPPIYVPVPGPIGPQGEVGPIGPPGVDGVDGAVGPAGPTGTVAAAGDGTAALPSITFASDTNTGFFHPVGADTLGISTNGVLRWTVGTAGELIANGTGVLSPTGNVVEQRNGTSAQTFRTYFSYTDAANYVRGGFRWNGGNIEVYNEGLGTGTAGAVALSGADGVSLYSRGVLRWFVQASAAGGHLLAGADDAYDIGLSGNLRPRNLYLAGTATVGGTINALSFRFTTDTDTGIDVPSANALGFMTGDTYRWFINETGYLYPGADNVYDIGYNATSYRPRNLYLAGTATVGGGAYFGGSLTFSASNTYDIGASAVRVRTIYASNMNASGSIYCNDYIQALTRFLFGSNLSLRSGVGLPAAGTGNDGDLYFRVDTPGTANQRIYVRSAGAWAGIL